MADQEKVFRIRYHMKRVGAMCSESMSDAGIHMLDGAHVHSRRAAGSAYNLYCIVQLPVEEKEGKVVLGQKPIGGDAYNWI